MADFHIILGKNCQAIQSRALCFLYAATSQVGREIYHQESLCLCHKHTQEKDFGSIT
ncbi:UNVERIFIED_CONTAM: hypothetical protein FKN15_008694 [Acipenser sinensis]